MDKIGPFSVWPVSRYASHFSITEAIVKKSYEIDIRVIRVLLIVSLLGLLLLAPLTVTRRHVPAGTVLDCGWSDTHPGRIVALVVGPDGKASYQLSSEIGSPCLGSW